MIPSIKSITLSRKKGLPRENVDQCLLIENSGIEGDRFANPGSPRQLSLASVEALYTADTLCSKKFTPNFITDGLDYGALKAGQLINASGCILELTEVGKQCHEECNKASRCRLADNCAWARVIKGGTVKVGSLIHTIS